MENKGQAYLIVSFILVTILATVAFTARTTVYQRTEAHFLMENIERELPLAYTAGSYQDDINNIMREISNEFREFSYAKGYQLQLVFSATETRGAARFYHIGNWWGHDCTYYNSKVGPIAIADGETVFHPRGWFQNDYDLIICGQNLDLTEDFDYRAEIHRTGEVVVGEG